jgi:hypothetical protein
MNKFNHRSRRASTNFQAFRAEICDPRDWREIVPCAAPDEPRAAYWCDHSAVGAVEPPSTRRSFTHWASVAEPSPCVRDLLVQVVVVGRPDEKALVRLWQEKRGQVGPEDRERPDRAPEVLMPAQGDRLCCSGPALSPRELTYRFLRLGNPDGGAFERLGRYNAALWKQTAQTLLLGSVRRR